MSMPNTTEISRLITSPVTPLIFCTNGAMGYECEKFHKELALKLSIQRSEKYSITLNWIRTHLAFSILHSSLLCLRDTRVGFYAPLARFEFACADAHIL